MTPPTPELSLIEARVLAVLVEKELTVPDTYPLTLNTLVTGCNQRTSRDPVMALGEPEVLQAIDRLRSLSLVIESSGSRVMRYSQNMRRVLAVPAESVALLAVLMLRGPQTAAELRANCDRLQRFSDMSAIEGFLEELAHRSAGALVVHLPRQPGARESRWAHLLCGADAVPAVPAVAARVDSGSASDTPGTGGSLATRVAALEEALAAANDEIAALKERVGRLCGELGLD